MSLILDALKKIEREKGAGDPGVVVVGSVPWGQASPRRFGRTATVAGVALGLVSIGAWWWLRPALAPVPAPAPAAAPSTSASTQPSATASRPPTAPIVPAPPAPRHTATPHPEPTGASGPAAVVARPAAGDRAAVPLVSAPGAAADAASAPLATASEPRPTRGSPSGWPELHLGAISLRDGRPVALVNDRVVREGDSFDGVLVVRIGDAEVEVEFRGQRRVLRF